MKNNISIPVGTSLLLVVMVIITLISFSTISLSSAQRDYNLVYDISISTKEYYDTDTLIQKELMNIDNILHDIYNKSNNKEEYILNVINYDWKYNIIKEDNIYLDYSIKVNDKEELYCKIKIKYPNNTQAYNIDTLILRNTDVWKGNSTFPLLVE